MPMSKYSVPVVDGESKIAWVVAVVSAIMSVEGDGYVIDGMLVPAPTGYCTNGVIHGLLHPSAVSTRTETVVGTAEVVETGTSTSTLPPFKSAHTPRL